MTRRNVTLVLGAVLVVVLGALVALLPVPYVALGPGPTVNTLGSYQGHKVITVTGHPISKSAGHLNLTTVGVTTRLQLVTAVRGWFDDRYAVVPREVIYPPGQTAKQVQQADVAQFKRSQSSAETAALRELGYPVHVVIVKLSADSASAGKLAPGDRIVSVDGATVTSSEKLIQLIVRHHAGDTVRVGYLRNGTRGVVPIRLKRATADGTTRPVIGVTIKDVQPHPFKIHFDINNIGGPSAGLMFTLGIIDLLRPVDLTGGRFIAGTGTIDDEGNVGPIGGIHQKMVAARAKGATIFLTPAGNCAEAASDVPAGLRLVRITSLHTALAALRTLRSGGTPRSCVSAG